MKNAAPVTQGQTIAGKYQVECVLGEGGMGVVVAAWHLGLQQRVAIKFLLAEFAEDHTGAPERFRREARAAARIRSEHVCRVLDVGTLDNGVPFMVMEYMEGCDLYQELLASGRPSLDDSIEYILQACEALAEAHVAGIVHRDLKPANLYLAKRPDGSRAIKVLDFGVSKSISDHGVSHLTLTQTASLVGSPIYMSPEQIESSKDVDPRADIWALGTILYELATGRTPFDGQSIAQLVNAVLNTEPPTFAALGVHAPAGFEEVVRRALEKKRDHRFASVGEFAEALAPYAPPRAAASITRVTRVLAPESEPSQRHMFVTSQEVSAPFRNSARRGRYAAGAVLILVPLMFAALYVLFGRSSNDAVTVPSGTENVLRAAAPTLEDAGIQARAKSEEAAPAAPEPPTTAPEPTRVVADPAQTPTAQAVEEPTPAAQPAAQAPEPSSKPSSSTRTLDEAREPPRATTQKSSGPPISDFGGRR